MADPQANQIMARAFFERRGLWKAGMSKLLSDRPCEVDPAIEDAINRGYLAGVLKDIRSDLMAVCACVWSDAEATYRDFLSSSDVGSQKEAVQDLIASIEGFVGHRREEIGVLQDIVEKIDGSTEHDEFAAKLSTRSKAIDLSERLMKELRTFVDESFPSPARGPQPDQAEKAFFVRMSEWWNEEAICSDRRAARPQSN